MLELWQTEWCPASRRIRERLTELGVDYVTRQVPVDKEQRVALRRDDRHRHDPGARTRPRQRAIGEDEIARYLDDHVPVPAEAEAHRLKAAKARRRYLEEECECLQPATH